MKKESSARPLRGLAAAAAVALFLLGLPLVSPMLNWLLGRAVLFTTVLDMPTGTLKALREQYGDAIMDEAPEPAPVLPLPPPEEPEEPPSPAPPEAPAEVPEVPEQYRGSISELTMVGDASPAYCRWGEAYIRNYTKLTNAQIEAVLETPCTVRLNQKSAQPQVLLFHTHATESFEPYDSTFFDTRRNWRDTDNANNMVAVGDVLAQGLETAGVAVLHDPAQHDNPSYTGAYLRSTAMIEDYQEQYRDLRILLDIHRDGIVYSDTSIAKTTAVVNGKKAAQLMIIAPYDDGTLNIPNWRENLRFAVELTDRINAAYPDLMRPIFFCSRTYNFACSDGALLLEFGTNGNTLEEAQYTAALIAPIIAKVLRGE